MKILIIGGSGFLGSNLIPHLSKDYEITNWDLSEGKDLFGLTEDVVKQHDFVIHLAAITSVDQSFSNPDKVFITNVAGTAHIARLCYLTGVKLIYPSSSAIYQPDSSPYAHSKYIAEEIVKGIMKTTSVVIFRFFNIYGKGMRKESGSIMYNFLHNDKLIVFGDGEQTRDFISIKDVISIIEDSLYERWNGVITDVGTGTSYTVNYIASLFSKYRNIPLQYEPPRKEIKWSKADRTMLDKVYEKELVTDVAKDIEELCQNP